MQISVYDLYNKRQFCTTRTVRGKRQRDLQGIYSILFRCLNSNLVVFFLRTYYDKIINDEGNEK